MDRDDDLRFRLELLRHRSLRATTRRHVQPFPVPPGRFDRVALHVAPGPYVDSPATKKPVAIVDGQGALDRFTRRFDSPAHSSRLLPPKTLPGGIRGRPQRVSTKC